MLDKINRWLYNKLHIGCLPSSDIGVVSNDKIKPYFSKKCSFGLGHGSDAEVHFVIEPTHTRICIVNKDGEFVNFPGIEHEEFIAFYCGKEKIKPVIQFRTDFEDAKDGKYLIIWEIQPDGCYWGDKSGFGKGNECEVRLYSYLDLNGKFIAPFRIYNIGDLMFFGTNLEEEWVQEFEKRQATEQNRIASGEHSDDALRRLIDRSCDFIIENFLVEPEKSIFVCFDVPESRYEAYIRITGSKANWRIVVDVKIVHSDCAFSNYFSSGGRCDWEWILDRLKLKDTRDSFFDSIKELSERIDRD